MLKLRTIKMHRDGVDWPPPNKWCTDPWTLVRRAVSTLYGTCRPALGPAPADDCVRCMFWHSFRWPHICPGIHLCSDNIGNSYTYFDEFGWFVMQRESEFVIVNQRFELSDITLGYLILFFLYASQYLYRSKYIFVDYRAASIRHGLFRWYPQILRHYGPMSFWIYSYSSHQQ